MSSDISADPARNKKKKTCWGLWMNCCHSIDNVLKQSFGKLSDVLGKHPFIFIGVIIGCTTLLSVGLATIKMETSSELLFTPQGSRSAKDLVEASKYFKFKFRVEEVIISSGKWRDVLRKEMFRITLALLKKILSLEGTNQLCVKLPQTIPGSISSCLIESSLDCFYFNESKMENITETLNFFYKSNFIMSNGKFARDTFKHILGDLQFNNSQVKFAKSLRLAFFMPQSENVDIASKVLSWEQRFIDLMERERKHALISSVNIFYYAARSLDDSISASALSDVKLVVISIFLMILFCVWTMSSFQGKQVSHAYLSLLGILAIILGIASSFGLILISTIPFTGLVGILPFLILGVGIDNIFIIINTLDSEEMTHTGTARVKKALSKAGSSITMTTGTTVVAFAVSTATNFLGIRYFCIYAALAIIFVYLMMVTFFMCCLHLDVRRIERGKRDAFQCCNKQVPADNPWQVQKTVIFTKVMNRYAVMLMNKVSKIVVMCTAACLLAAGIYGTYYLDQSFDSASLGRDGSYQKKFIEIKRKQYPQQTDVSVIVIGSKNYSNIYFQKKYIELSTIVSKNAYFQKDTSSWMRDFRKWTGNNNLTSSGPLFYKHLMVFLTSQQYSTYLQDIVFGSDNKSIVASRIRGKTLSQHLSVFKKNAMLSLRQDLDNYKYIKAFPISYIFVYFEQFAAILMDTVQNLALSATAVLLVTAPYLIFPSVTFLVFMQFLSLVVELLGLMFAWGVSLNSISMIVIIMAIGFSVDYSAHIAHSYVHNSRGTPDERVIQALSEMGSSVIMGGFTTFLGMLVTAFASSEVFRIFFKMVFGIVVLGLLHGLVFLPVFLSIFCRGKLEYEDEEDQPKEETLQRKEEALSSERTLSAPQVAIVGTHEDKNYNASNTNNNKIEPLRKDHAAAVENLGLAL